MTETTEKTLEQRILESGLGMTATPIQTQPPAWAKRMNGWRCTLRLDGRTMTTTFWIGPGHGGARPTTADVIDCLLSDAAIFEHAVEEASLGKVTAPASFARDLGYDDPREADRVWMAVVQQTTRLKRFLRDGYSDWVWETRRD